MNDQQKIKRPVLRYHGGKWMLAPWIISHFPKHKVYVEAFGGGGSVLMRKERSYSEVYNDVWDIVVNVFQVLRNPAQAAELEKQIRLTPYSRSEFMFCGDQDIALVTDPVEKARRTILRSFAGFGSASTNSTYSTGFRANANRNGTTPAHDWSNWPDSIKLFVQRLQGVVIESKDYKSVIAQQDSPDTLFYLDPPYKHETRNMKRGNAAYAHEMTDSDHETLCHTANAITGMAIISGYDNEMYNDLLKGWYRSERHALADGARKRTEVLWINPSAYNKKLQS